MDFELKAKPIQSAGFELEPKPAAEAAAFGLTAKPTEVAVFLTELGLAEYAPSFEENAIDMDVLLGLTEEELKTDVGISKLGHRRIIMAGIAEPKQETSPPATQAPARSTPPALTAPVAPRVSAVQTGAPYRSMSPHGAAQIAAVSSRSRVTAGILALFLGAYGIDQFYLGNTSRGLLKLFTVGGFLVLWAFDVVTVWSGKATDGQGLPVTRD